MADVLSLPHDVARETSSSSYAEPDAPVEAVREADVASLPLPDLRGHLPSLDGLRGLAIILVLLCHFLPHADHPSSLLGKLFFFVGRTGWSGVDLFFVLSGFLITGILLDSKEGATPHFFRNFYARRTLRIFPLYYGVLAVVFLVVPLINSHAFDTPELSRIRHQQGWLWTYCTNVKMWLVNDNDSFHAGWLDLNPFWSLAVEEHFYLLWPAIVYVLSRRKLIGACLGVVIAATFCRAYTYHRGYTVWAIYVFTPGRADALALGGLLAALLREGGAAARFLTANAGKIALVTGPVWLYGIYKDPEHETLLNLTLGYFLVAAFYGALLVRSLTAGRGSAVGAAFYSKFMRTLGKYSYGLYVYHVVLHSTFDRFFDQRDIDAYLHDHLHLGKAAYGASVMLYIVLASAISFGVAFASWHLFEMQFLKLKRFFKYHKRRTPVAVD